MFVWGGVHAYNFVNFGWVIWFNGILFNIKSGL